MSRKQMPFWDFSCRFSSHPTQTNKLNCFIYPRYTVMLYTLYFIVTHSAPQENIYGEIAMVTKMKNTFTHKERKRERETETNLKDKMPTDVLKRRRCQRSSLWFSIYLCKISTISPSTIPCASYVQFNRHSQLIHFVFCWIDSFYERQGFCSLRTMKSYLCDLFA